MTAAKTQPVQAASGKISVEQWTELVESLLSSTAVFCGYHQLPLLKMSVDSGYQCRVALDFSQMEEAGTQAAHWLLHRRWRPSSRTKNP